MSLKLYEIDLAMLQLLETADESGELNDAVATELDNLAMDREHKIESICQVIRTATAQEAAYRAEMDRLEMSRRQETARIEWLKDYLKRSMMASGDKKIEAGTFKIRIQNNSVPSVSVLCDPEQLPEWARRIKVEADKKEIGDRWKADGTLPPGVTAEVGTHLRIS